MPNPFIHWLIELKVALDIDGGRSIQVRLTDSGRELIERVFPKFNAGEKYFVEGLTDSLTDDSEAKCSKFDVKCILEYFTDNIHNLIFFTLKISPFISIIAMILIIKGGLCIF